MNLNLEQKNGAHILKVSGDIDSKGTEILRAGITKLMKSGKDKIILDLSKVGGIDEKLLAEIALLNHLATELNGKVIVAGAPKKFEDTVKKHGNPPPFLVLGSVEEATKLLKQSGQIAEELSPELQQLIRAKDLRIQALEGQIALSNPDEMRKLRRENEEIREANRKLEGQLNDFMLERRNPPDAEAALEKIMMLEHNLLEMSNSLKAGSNAKK